MEKTAIEKEEKYAALQLENQETQIQFDNDKEH